MTFGLLAFLGPEPAYAVTPPTETLSALGWSLGANSPNQVHYASYSGQRISARQKIRFTVTARRGTSPVLTTELHVVGCTVQIEGVSRDPLDKVISFKGSKGSQTFTVPDCGYLRVQASAHDSARNASFTGWMIFRVG